jgi:hypothetical protein
MIYKGQEPGLRINLKSEVDCVKMGGWAYASFGTVGEESGK